LYDICTSQLKNLLHVMPFVKYILLFIVLLYVPMAYCQQIRTFKNNSSDKEIILPGSYALHEYLPLLKNKKVAIVANHTSLINQTHLVDSLIALGIQVTKIFGPEHGFRGNEPDGKEINNLTDPKTGIQVISLYGAHKKPTSDDLSNTEIVVFDIQDVGVRFYTYISTLTYVMEACAENNIPLLVTDRPNPNAYYVDGPILKPAFTSFVGMHPVPIVYGMTIGEYATMVNDEKWLKNGITCNLTIIKCHNYTHYSRYQLSVKPSPNLQDMKSIYLYPSLCLFEGTVVSVGRGTNNPFKVYGHPELKNESYSFTPKPIKGVSEDPPLKGKLCYGKDVSSYAQNIHNKGRLELVWLLDTYKKLHTKTDFFTSYFDKLVGDSTLREQIIAGKNEKEIRKTWQPGIADFMKIRKKYLLYPDFR